MDMNWLSIGFELARLLIPTVLSLVLGGLIFRKWIAPEFEARYADAAQTVTNLAKLAGVKSQEYTGAKNIEKLVATDFIASKIPELHLVKAAVSADTWAQIEEQIEENPEVIIQLWDKYGHYFTKNGAPQDDVDYNF